MQQFTIDNGGRRRSVVFRAEVPTLVKPVIKETKVIAGERFYVCKKNKFYLASVFDRMWGVLAKVKIKPRYFKEDIVKRRNGNAIAV